jgi:hypothetical protein
MISLFRISVVIISIALFVEFTFGQTVTQLKPETSVNFLLQPKQTREFAVVLKSGDVCDLHVKVDERFYVEMDVRDPSGQAMVKGGDARQGYLFIADAAGTYKIIIHGNGDPQDSSVAASASIVFSNKLNLPKNAKTVATRVINGYNAKIVDEAGDSGKSYLIIQKADSVKAIMRAEKEIGGGFFFSDGSSEFNRSSTSRTATLMRTTADKTGDGTPDVAVEYYTGGAHCCFQITFFELGKTVRQLPTIDTNNDELTAISRKPGGGLRFEVAEQAFAYWAIAFALSPMPTVIYEFDQQDELIPRFDLMKKPAPSLAMLRRKAAAAKAKLNFNSYTSPEDNFNDFDEAFWGEMLDLIYTGHADLAWKYFDMVWPVKKPGKEKFLADFKEQLANSAYGDAQNPVKRSF